MANNIITEENLTLIRDLIPNIVYNELMGRLEVEEKPIEVPTVEPVTESEDSIKIKKEINDIEELLDVVEGKEKKRLQKELNDLKETLELITM